MKRVLWCVVKGSIRISVVAGRVGNYKYVLNEETKEITEVIEGTFRQYPIRLAWAITIHKSQGLTFERAIIDARNSFAHGQTYVALSRCKTLEVWCWSLLCAGSHNK